MVIVESVPQAVFDHRVDQYAVAHTVAITSFRNSVRSCGHVFHTACYDNVGVAGFNHLSGEGYAAETGTADFVDRHSRRFNGETRFDHSLTSRVLALSSLENVAHNDFVNDSFVDACAFDGFFDNDSAQICCRNVFQGTAKFTNSCTASTYDYYFFHRKSLLMV